MIRGCEQRTPKSAAAWFAEEAALFSEGLFVILRVYADESGVGIDPTGQLPGSAVPTVCGYVQTPEYWRIFCRKWQTVLNDYRAPFFHFSELANKHQRAKKESPYYGWSTKKIDGFIHDLAYLISEEAIPAGGVRHAKLGHQMGIPGDPFEDALKLFFEDLHIAIAQNWPRYTGRILFVFDQTTNPKWLATIHALHEEWTKHDSRFGGLTFENDKDPAHIPLQAADLYAYACRQYAEKALLKSDDDLVEQVQFLNFLLMRLSVSPSERVPLQQWKRTVRVVKQDKARQEAIWKRQGIKQKYHPLEHHPLLAEHLKTNPNIA
jgi:hypothetical protein